jgi:hypothetical protein
MPSPTSTMSNYGISRIISMSTVADSIANILPVDHISWHLTTGATSTWALHITQSSAVAASTIAFPLVGATTQAHYLGGSTAAVTYAPVVTFPIQNWVFGLVISTMTGGSITVHLGPPGADWVIRRPYMPSTALVY